MKMKEVLVIFSLLTLTISSRTSASQPSNGSDVDSGEDDRDHHHHKRTNVDHFFLAILGIIVFFMQCGFAFLEAGAVRSKNTVNILIKNWLDTCLGALVYWAIGFGLTWGDGENPFCGTSHFLGIGVTNYDLSKFFFQFTFAATASTLVSGALAERCNFIAYLVYCNLITGLIYPLVAHWCWHPAGWLARQGFVDYAGSGVVHLCGAVCAVMGAWLMGPRQTFPPRAGRFKKNEVVAMPGHSVPLAALGGLILVFGFLAQNVGKHGTLSLPGDGEITATAATNTILATAMGGASVLVFNKILVSHQYSFLTCMNGSLTATVAVCAGCDRYSTWVSLLIGLVAGPIFIAADKLLLACRIDDPVNAVPVNGVGGILGLICAPLLRGDGKGLFYTWSLESLELFGWNMVGMVSIILWTGSTTGIIFWLLKRYNMLRVDLEHEFKGMDLMKHGESAYPADAWVELQYRDDEDTSFSLPPNMRYHHRKTSFNDPQKMFPGLSKMFSGINVINEDLIHSTIAEVRENERESSSLILQPTPV